MDVKEILKHVSSVFSDGVAIIFRDDQVCLVAKSDDQFGVINLEEYDRPCTPEDIVLALKSAILRTKEAKYPTGILEPRISDVVKLTLVA